MRSWKELRAERMRSPEAQAEYRKAQLAYEFGRRVRELREGRKMSQLALARAIGSTQPAIARLEAGGVDPRLSTMQRIAAVFEVPFTVFGDHVALAS